MHRHNLKEGLLEKSKLSQCVYGEGLRVVWDEARILEIERNSRRKKLTHVVCMKNPIS
jgi:hypothetical protein